jgi:hypothetical protein
VQLLRRRQRSPDGCAAYQQPQRRIGWLRPASIRRSPPRCRFGGWGPRGWRLGCRGWQVEAGPPPRACVPPEGSAEQLLRNIGREERLCGQLARGWLDSGRIGEPRVTPMTPATCPKLPDPYRAAATESLTLLAAAGRWHVSPGGGHTLCTPRMRVARNAAPRTAIHVLAACSNANAGCCSRAPPGSCWPCAQVQRSEPQYLSSSRPAGISTVPLPLAETAVCAICAAPLPLRPRV